MRWALGLISSFCSTFVYCQDLSREYFDNSGAKCSPASSYYYSEGKKNRNGFFYDTFKSYYSRSHHLRSLELRDQFGNRMGLCESFYENGNPKAKTRHDRKFGKNTEGAVDSIKYFILDLVVMKKP